MSSLSDIPSVEIDPSGRYKYILIKLRQNDHEKFVVRGHAWADYHGIGFLGGRNKKPVFLIRLALMLKPTYWINSRVRTPRRHRVSKSSVSEEDEYCTSPRKERSSSMDTRRDLAEPIIEFQCLSSKRNLPITRV